MTRLGNIFGMKPETPDYTVMSKLRNILLLTVWLWAATANAQPMRVTEHDWTLQIGKGRWGLLQTNMAPGDWRRTTVYCGTASFTVSTRAEVLLGAVLAALVLLGAVPMMGRRRKEPN